VRVTPLVVTVIGSGAVAVLSQCGQAGPYAMCGRYHEGPRVWDSEKPLVGLTVYGPPGRSSPQRERVRNLRVRAVYTRAPDETRVGVEIGFLAARFSGRSR